MVEVFRTNINSQEKATSIRVKLKTAFPDYKINFDLEDCDKILRIEVAEGGIDASTVAMFVRNSGFQIDVLPE